MFIALILDLVEKIGHDFNIESIEQLIEKEKKMELKVGKFEVREVENVLGEYGIRFGLSQDPNDLWLLFFNFNISMADMIINISKIGKLEISKQLQSIDNR